MYSKEIQELLKLKNNLVTLEEYLRIIQSPQIDHIKYENGIFNIWTNDEYKFELKIKC